MRSTSLLVLFLVAILSLSLLILWVGCGDDDDDDDDDSGSDDDDDSVDEGDKGQINGCVHDFQTKQPVQGALVELLDNTTGETLGVETTSPGGDGCVTLQIPEDYTQDEVGIRTSRDDYKTTVQFYFDDGLVGEEFLIVSNSTASLVALSLGITIDEEMGFAAGALYWGDETDENPIGCGKLEIDPPNPGNLHYFGIDNLPLTARDIVGDAPSDGQGTNPCCGNADPKSFYVSVNQPPKALGQGGITFTATVFATEDDEAGTGTTYVETNLLPVLEKNTVGISNIYFSKDTYTDTTMFPAPAWCTE